MPKGGPERRSTIGTINGHTQNAGSPLDLNLDFGIGSPFRPPRPRQDKHQLVIQIWALSCTFFGSPSPSGGRPEITIPGSKNGYAFWDPKLDPQSGPKVDFGVPKMGPLLGSNFGSLKWAQNRNRYMGHFWVPILGP